MPELDVYIRLVMVAWLTHATTVKPLPNFVITVEEQLFKSLK